MLSTEQLEAIKQVQSTCESLVIVKYIDILLSDIERLTQHNKRMRAALAEFEHIENWEDYDGWLWCGDGSPTHLAERALVEDGA